MSILHYNEIGRVRVLIASYLLTVSITCLAFGRAHKDNTMIKGIIVSHIVRSYYF